MKITAHALGGLGFLAVTFSLGFIFNDGGVQTIKELTHRKPAMMRLNPAVFGPKVRSDLEAAALPQPEEVEESSLERFGLTTRNNDFARGFDIRAIKPVTAMGFDYDQFLPTSLSHVTSESQVASQIFDHSVSNFFKQESVRGTFLGRAATTVEEKMRAEVAIGGDEPDSVQHNIKFQMKASQTRASMEYRGVTNADLSYSVSGRRTDLEIFEPLSDDARLVYSHSDQPDEKRDMLSIRVNW